MVKVDRTVNALVFVPVMQPFQGTVKRLTRSILTQPITECLVQNPNRLLPLNCVSILRAVFSVTPRTIPYLIKPSGKGRHPVLMSIHDGIPLER
jgi:hypothetical protein